MSKRAPAFLNSPYLIKEPSNWHLTDDAPEDVIREFIEYMNGDILIREEDKQYIEKLQKKLENK